MRAARAPAADPAAGAAKPHVASRSCCEYVTLSWLWPIIRAGFWKALVADDVPGIPVSYSSRNLVDKGIEAWEETHSVWSAMWELNSTFIIVGILAGGSQGLLNTVGRPFVLRAVVRVAISDDASMDQIAYLLVLFALIVFAEGFMGVISAHMLTDVMGTRFGGMVSGLVIRKSTRRQRETGGSPAETNLAGNDIVRTLENFRITAWIPMLVTALIGGVTVLVILIGYASLIGLFVMLSIVGLNQILSKKTKKAEKLNLQAADGRLGLMRQLIEGIQALKMHGWESKFLGKIEEVRGKECEHIQNFRILQVVSIALGRASPVLASCAAFTTFVLLGNDLQPEDIFAALTIFQALRMPLIMVPLSLTAYMNMVVSLERIGKFLKIPDSIMISPPDDMSSLVDVKNGSFSWTPPPRVDELAKEQGLSHAPTLGDQKTESDLGKRPSEVSLTIKRNKSGALLQSPSTHKLVSTQTLRNITLRVHRGSKVAIVGRVGSGKSSLLHAILGDLSSNTPGAVRRRGSIGWVPQQAFVLSATVRENVLMGRAYDKQRFTWAIHTASMERDLELLVDGDMTEVGERGTTLSGGQQQRLAIARALYSKPELLMMDDPLAAVDAKVLRTIFERSVEDYVTPKGQQSVLMALNQLHLLPKFDWIVFMRDGVIAEQGTFDTLMKATETDEGSADGFKAFVESHTHASEGNHQTDDEAEDTKTADAFSESKTTEAKLSEPTDAAAEKAAGFASESKSSSAPRLLRDCSSRKFLEVQAIKRKSLKPKLPKMGGIAEMVPETGGISPETSSSEPSEPNKNDQDEEDEKGAVTEENRLVKAETHATGAVTGAVIKTYMASMGYGFVVLCGIVLCLAYAMFVFNDVWLAIWASQNIQSQQENLFYIGIYVATSVGHVLLILTMSCLMAVGGVRASAVLHGDILNKVIRAPTSWFAETPSGRIISRFSSDLSVVDIRLALFIDNFLQIGAIIVVLLVTMCVVVPPVTVVVVLGIGMYTLQVLAVDRSNREVRRMVNNAMSPMLTNISETSNGRLLAQSMGLTSYFLDRHFKFTDTYSAYNLVSFALLSWGRHASNVASFVISLSTALLVLLQRHQYNETQIALALTYAFLVPYFLMVQSMNVSFLNVGLTSLERVLEFKSDSIPQEADWRSPKDPEPDTWPTQGDIDFEKVFLRYRNGQPYAIKGASFTIQSGEKCGVVGRTGAGKSSLVVLLFRIVESAGGKIYIDGKDIRKLGLQTVREAIAIIPQHPLLLEGTVRHNLDPFNEYDDQTLVKVLKDVGLSENMLHSEVGHGGSSLSAGERQLISFGRAMVRRAKIVIMDEPTANIDVRTDDKIQMLVRSNFSDATVLTIAHRLSTIIDYDKILVMDQGKVAEFGPAAELLKNENGYLTSMVDSTGPTTSAKLRNQANNALRSSESASAARQDEKKTMEPVEWKERQAREPDDNHQDGVVVRHNHLQREEGAADPAPGPAAAAAAGEAVETLTEAATDDGLLAADGDVASRI